MNIKSISIVLISLTGLIFLFQNCSGSQAEFSNGEIMSKSELISLIQSDESTQVLPEEKEDVFEVMIEKEIEDIAEKEENLTEIKPKEEITKEAEEIALKENKPIKEFISIDKEEIIENPDDINTYLCKKNGKSKKIKYMICHVPKGNSDSRKTLCLPKVALKAHLKHLDNDAFMSYMGPCK